MKTLTKSIPELLNMTPEVYQEGYFQQYMRWCLSFSVNKENDFQKLLANRAIANYYNDNFQKLEQKFVEAATPIFGTVRSDAIRHLYAAITVQMYQNYPSVLFSEARCLNISNLN